MYSGMLGTSLCVISFASGHILVGASLGVRSAGRIDRLVDLSLVRGADQVVLERKERRARARVDADLAVHVDDVRVHRRP